MPTFDIKVRRTDPTLTYDCLGIEQENMYVKSLEFIPTKKLSEEVKRPKSAIHCEQEKAKPQRRKDLSSHTVLSITRDQHAYRSASTRVNCTCN